MIPWAWTVRSVPPCTCECCWAEEGLWYSAAWGRWADPAAEVYDIGDLVRTTATKNKFTNSLGRPASYPGTIDERVKRNNSSIAQSHQLGGHLFELAEIFIFPQLFQVGNGFWVIEAVLVVHFSISRQLAKLKHNHHNHHLEVTIWSIFFYALIWIAPKITNNEQRIVKKTKQQSKRTTIRETYPADWAV